ncbi:chloride channel protein [Nonomuraea roseola]|uniref:Chloride channel protein n=1 Tax=Nonomuraea roseola TaxID=46179 RepID=A0ABV5QG23_9ACTN
MWDRLFAPLIAAGAGAITTVLVASPVLSVEVPDYAMGPLDLVSAVVIAAVGTLLGLAVVYAFPHVHRLFHRIRHPLVRYTVGGVVLGLLGVIGGLINLFKGLHEMKELTANAAAYTAAALALIVVVKLAALPVAASTAFVGGRIFPAVFAGVALGLAAHALVPCVPVALAITCGVLGISLAVSPAGLAQPLHGRDRRHRHRPAARAVPGPAALMAARHGQAPDAHRGDVAVRHDRHRARPRRGPRVAATPRAGQGIP